MSKIHAYMKPRFDMNTYELARSLMDGVGVIVIVGTDV
jgi:hypothetical protein